MGQIVHGTDNGESVYIYGTYSDLNSAFNFGPQSKNDAAAFAEFSKTIHDEHLDRTTNGSGSLAAAGLAAVRRLDAGNDEQVPLLSEVLTLLDGKVGINVELKGPGTAEPTSQLLRKACQTGRWRADQFLLSAFDHAELQRADPIFARGVLWGRPVPDMVERSLAMGGQWMNIALKAATEDRITAAQQAGLKVAVYTVNEPADLAAMRALKVDAVFCDFPERGLQG